ncbi:MULTISPECIES: MerR family transcriptional regulator [unclassified Streptomyces]|uniref:MerR family transcriptional regulator n=1 Tax=unclassified Streptomyces TaxID=2593676 RepID=UPI001F07F8A5|nr:MerR family transcriptional regulator [Streptomyces sp. CB09001]
MKSSADEQSMTIGELAQRFGLRAHVLRHWDATGLLPPAERVNGRRRYTSRHIARVAMIVRGKAAGFSLEQLRAVLDAPSPDERRSLLRRQHAELERRIKEIVASRTLIEHALDCRAEDFTQCPGFRGLVQQLAREDEDPACAPAEGPAPRPVDH